MKKTCVICTKEFDTIYPSTLTCSSICRKIYELNYAKEYSKIKYASEIAEEFICPVESSRARKERVCAFCDTCKFEKHPALTKKAGRYPLAYNYNKFSI
jgi:hypothetical protein